MPIQLLLIGGGGHCLSCMEVLRSTGKYGIHGIVDNHKGIGFTVLDSHVIGTDGDLPFLLKDCKSALITVGQITSATVRVGLFNTLVGLGYTLPAIFASTSYVADSAEISQGSIVMHHALVNVRASIGVNCIINTKALVEHDTTIGDHTHVSTGSIVNGECTIGKRCFIGSGVVIRQGSSIADDCIIGAGAVVTSDLMVPGVYIGTPARLQG